MIKSLRYRLLIWFIFSTVLIAGLSFLLSHAHKSNKTAHWAAIEKLEFLRYQFLKGQKEINNFVANDLDQESFYISGESQSLSKHYALITQTDSCFIDLFSENIPLICMSGRSIVCFFKSKDAWFVDVLFSQCNFL